MPIHKHKKSWGISYLIIILVLLIGVTGGYTLYKIRRENRQLTYSATVTRDSSTSPRRLSYRVTPQGSVELIIVAGPDTISKNISLEKDSLVRDGNDIRMNVFIDSGDVVTRDVVNPKLTIRLHTKLAPGTYKITANVYERAARLKKINKHSVLSTQIKLNDTK